MLTRKELTHAVIWPAAAGAILRLIAPKWEVVNPETGEVEEMEDVPIGQIELEGPMRGADLARMMPDGMLLGGKGCNIVSLSGEVVHQTKRQFETVVVTERAERTLEDRLAAIESANRRRQREHEAVMKRLAEKEAALNVVEPEPTPELTPEPEPEVTPEPTPESEGGAA